MGRVLEKPSAAARRALREHDAQLDSQAKAEAEAEVGALLIAVAGHEQPVPDPGPGVSVYSQTIERAAGGALCNPFPMGEGGIDEQRLELVVELHRRLLAERTTAAKDMTMVGGGSLPVDVQPHGANGELTGEMVVTQLKVLVTLAARLGAETTIRLECGPSCRAGRMCHGLELARLTRVLQSAYRARRWR